MMLARDKSFETSVERGESGMCMLQLYSRRCSDGTYLVNSFHGKNSGTYGQQEVEEDEGCTRHTVVFQLESASTFSILDSA